MQSNADFGADGGTILTSKITGIIVAIVVLGAVLIPIVNGLADNMGGGSGGGSGGPSSYTNSGDYYYDIPADGIPYFIWFEGDSVNNRMTMDIRVIPNEQTMPWDVTPVKTWTFNYPYSAYIPLATDGNGGVLVDVQIYGADSSDSSIYMTVGGVGAGIDLSEECGMIAVASNGIWTYKYTISSGDVDNGPYYEGECYALNEKSNGPYVYANNPKVVGTTKIIGMDCPVIGSEKYEGDDSTYSVKAYYKYLGVASSLSNDASVIDFYCYGEDVDYELTSFSFVNESDGFIQLGPIDYALEQPDDIASLQYTSPFPFRALVPTVVEGESEPSYASGNNPDTWMKMAYGEDPTFSITLDYVTMMPSMEDWDPIAYASFSVQSNGTMTAPVDDLRDALYEADQSQGQDGGLAYGIVASGTIIPLVAWEDAETYSLIMVDLSQGYFSCEIYEKSDGTYSSESLGSSVTGIEGNGTTITVHYESDEDSVFDLGSLAPLKVYYADAKGGYGVYHASDILNTDGTVKASLYRTSETIHQYYVNAGVGAVSRAYIDGRQVGMYDTGVSIEMKETLTSGKVSFEGWHANIHYQNDTYEEEDIFASSFIFPLHADNDSSEGGSGSGGNSVTGTLLKTIPIFVAVAIILAVVGMFYTREQNYY